ncbi:MAG: hypothetical protein ACK4P3_01010 [Fimbriimonadaceae bacterium]
MATKLRARSKIEYYCNRVAETDFDPRSPARKVQVEVTKTVAANSRNIMNTHAFRILSLAFLATAVAAGSSAQTIWATGNEVPGQNRLYAINARTGVAIEVAPVSATFAAFAANQNGQLVAINSQVLGILSKLDFTFNPVTTITGLSSTGLDILAEGKIVGTTTGASATLFEVDPVTGNTIVIGQSGGIKTQLDDHFGVSTSPFIIGLGSIGNTVYGINIESNRTNLVGLNATSGVATVFGANNAVGATGYSGFAAMTGVDTSGNGQYDAIFGGASFLNSNRVGAVLRHNTTSGVPTLVGTNTGLLYFGMGSSPRAPQPNALFWMNSGTGVAISWQFASGELQSAQGGFVPDDSAWVLRAVGDISERRQPDLFWQNSQTGQVVMWQLIGDSAEKIETLGFAPNADWQVVAAGDTDGDFRSNLIWQNSTTFDVVSWSINPNGTVYSTRLLAEGVPGWRFVTLADVNGDANDDYVWFNPTTSEVAIWLIDNSGNPSTSVQVGAATSGWVLEAAGRFSPSVGVSLVWRNESSGALATWTLDNAGSVVSTGLIPGQAPAGWSIAGAVYRQ